MKFQTEEEVREVAKQLANADFERADFRLEDEGVLVLETARPAAKNLIGAGLFRKEAAKWIRCQFVLRHLTALAIWEEFDIKPPLGPLVEVAKMNEGFSIHLRSARGLRVDLKVSRLGGELRDLA